MTEEQTKIDLTPATPTLLAQMALDGGKVLAKQKQYHEADKEFNERIKGYKDDELRARATEAVQRMLPKIDVAYKRFVEIHKLCSGNREREMHRLFMAIFNSRFSKTVVIKPKDGQGPNITFGKKGFGIRWRQQSHESSRDEMIKYVLSNPQDIVKGLRQYKQLLPVADDFEKFVEIVTKNVGLPSVLEMPIERPFIFVTRGYSPHGFATGLAETLKVTHSEDEQYRYGYRGRPEEKRMPAMPWMFTEKREDGSPREESLSLSFGIGSVSGKIDYHSGYDKTFSLALLALEERLSAIVDKYIASTQPFIEAEDVLNQVRVQFGRRILLTEV